MNDTDKRITVVKAESGEYTDLTISIGTTAREILNEVGLAQSHKLSAGENKSPFEDEDNVYSAVEDGTKLFATAPINVAR